MTVWCYKTDCIYCDFTGAKDKDGDFGECLKEEIIIGNIKDCRSYEPKEEQEV